MKFFLMLGGATQNSIRTAKWILGDSGKTAYFGCVGKDEAAKILKDRAAHDGVDARYYYFSLVARITFLF